LALILNIETATTNCSVSVAKNGKTLALKDDYSQGFSHAECLHLYIDEVLNQARINARSLDAIAVSKGPGSYTGLRIGVSAAKGLCFALDKPLISVATLDSLARQVNSQDGFIVPMLDARRMEVYSAVFNTSLIQIRETQAQILDEASFSEYLKEGKVSFIGTGVEKTKGLIKHDNAVFVDDKLPSAINMSELSFAKFKVSDFEDVAYFEPYYLKDFIAIKPKN